MKLHILHDSDGRILAAAKASPDTSGPIPYAQPNSGQVMTELLLPEGLQHHDLPHICQNYRVDAKRRQLVPHKVAE